MKVAIIYNVPAGISSASEDVSDVVELVSGAVGALGHDQIRVPIVEEDPLPLNLKLIEVLKGLHDYGPDIVFNLVETLWGRQRFHPAFASIIEMAGYRVTGGLYDCLLATTDKTLTKTMLANHGLPTPEWSVYKGDGFVAGFPPPWIVKPAWEDASVGIDGTSVVWEMDALTAKLDLSYKEHRGQPILVERYIEGREFNISLLEHPDGRVSALPPAEMVFRSWPEGKPKIVDYRAKWAEDSFEFKNTARVFPAGDALLPEISALALKCWEVFGLRGYARVDLRADINGSPFIIEVNANPCIAPDSGFMAAAREAGIEPEDVIREIIGSALEK
jgi:D-alanine-D-alanine ligase